MTAFACIFVPDFPVQALLRVEPDLRSQAVAVLEGKAPLEKVFAVNEQARHAGVEMGMTKLQVEACPELVLRTRSPLQEHSAHAALLDCAQILDTLSRWGIRNLRALAALPEIALSERLGQEGVRLQQLARGATSRTLVPVEPPLVFEEAIELEHPLVLVEPLAFLLARMLEQLCARLSARALATQEIRLQLELDNGSHIKTFHRTLRLPVPLLDEKIFLKLLQ